MMNLDMIELMLQTMLPLKFDTKIKLSGDENDVIEIKLKGVIFKSRMKGETEDKVFIAINLPEREE